MRPEGGDPAGGRPHPPGLSGLPHGPGSDPGEAGGYSPLPTGAQVVVLREVLPILLVPVGEGGAVPGAADPHPSGAAAPVPGERKQIRATVASPRLDAVAAAGFSIPRSRARELIRGGRVMVNHRPWRQSRQGRGGRGCAHLPGPGKVCAAGDRRHLQAGQDHFGAGTVFVKERDRNPLRAEKPARGREVP